MKDIKQLRLDIDTCINSVVLLDPSAEVTLAFREMQRSKMWLGQVLALQGRPTPYPESDNAKSPVIEQQAEHVEGKVLERMWEVNGPTARVKFMRNEIQKILDTEYKLSDQETEDILEYSVKAKMHLMESKMWLGMELNRILKTTKIMNIKETNQLLSFADFRKFSDTIVETGSGLGGGIELMIEAGYKRILSVEAKDTYHQHNLQKFAPYNQVDLFFGMSKDMLPYMISPIFAPAVFFLDAHVSGPNSAGHEDYTEKGNDSLYAQDNCLTSELKMILDHRPDHVIIIDDQNGENDENVKYRQMCLAVNPNYQFFFYDEKRGDTLYKNKSLVCIPMDAIPMQA